MRTNPGPLLLGVLFLTAPLAGFSDQPALAAPTNFKEAITWLQQRSDRMIRDCRRTTSSGIAAFPPQVGGGYEAFWLRDYAYMLEGNAAGFTPKELKDSCRFLLGGQRADGAMVDCIKFDGTPCYMPGYGTIGSNPVADGGMFAVAVLWHTWERTRDKELLADFITRAVRGMQAVPRDPQTGLVLIQPGDPLDRAGYGFTDTIRKQGQELFCSLLYVQAARQLSDLLKALDRAEEAGRWHTDADRIAGNIRSVFWDPDTGLFRAATLKCNQPDIWGSAFAVRLGVATADQANAIAVYFRKNYQGLVQNGQLRHLPPGMNWESTSTAPGTYQNGAYWATPVGWFVYTLDLADPALANQTVLDLVRDFITRNDENECVNGAYANVSHYVVSATLPLEGISAMQTRRAGNVR